jgi:hypothetical protein
LIHYADLQADTAAVLQGLADDLGFDYPPARIAELADHATLTQMRARASDLTPEVDTGAWRDPAQFFANGRLGAWRSAFTEAELLRYQEHAAELYPDEAFLSWTHNGAAGGDWRIASTRH